MQTDVSAEWDEQSGCFLPAAKPSGLGKVGVVVAIGGCGGCVRETYLKYYVQLHA